MQPTSGTVEPMYEDAINSLRTVLGSLRRSNDPRCAPLAAELARLLITTESDNDAGEVAGDSGGRSAHPARGAEATWNEPAGDLTGDGDDDGEWTEDDLYAAARAAMGDDLRTFVVEYRRCTNQPTPFDEDQLARVLDLSRYTLDDFGALFIVNQAQLDADRWEVTYEVLEPGRVPLAAVAGGAVAWRGTMPIPEVGLVEAVGRVPLPHQGM
jgi:hypothetical protein